MGDGNPSISVIDGQFFLQTLLADAPWGRTYRATHASGMEVVVKLVYRAEHFFDRLARLYALEGSAYFSHCLCNYPPLAYGAGDPLVGYLEPLPRDIDPSQIGVLVLEWIDGTPFAQLLERADPMERVDALLELTLALLDLERAGMCHGRLAHDHLLIEQDSRELKIIGLALDPPGWCEDDFRQPPLGLAHDLAWVAGSLAQGLDVGQKIRRFQRRCEQPGAEVSAGELYGLLKQVRRRMRWASPLRSRS